MSSLLMFSCGSKKESPVQTPAGPNPIQIDLTSVESQQIGSASKTFHDTGIKYLSNDKYDVTQISTIVPNGEPGSFLVSHYIKIVDKLSLEEKTYGENVVDFILLEDKILVLETNEKTQYLLTTLSFEGEKIDSKLFIDITINEDKCYKELAFLKNCGKSEDGTLRRYSHYVPYQAGRLQKSKMEKNSFFMMLDTHALSTNLYKVKMTGSDYEIERKKQVQANVNLQFPIPVYLTSGYELLTLNRFSRHMRKIFEVTDEDEIILGINLFKAYGLNRLLEIKDEENKEEYFYLTKFDAKFETVYREFHESLMVDHQDYMLNTSIVNNKMVLGTTSFKNTKGGLSDFSLHLLNTKSGKIMKGQQIDLTAGDYLTAIKLNEDSILAASFNGVSQNPQGMSIGGYGAIGFSLISMDLEVEKTTYFKVSGRKDLIQDFTVSNGKVRALTDFNGPVTHTADNNIELGRQSSALMEFDLLD